LPLKACKLTGKNQRVPVISIAKPKLVPIFSYVDYNGGRLQTPYVLYSWYLRAVKDSGFQSQLRTISLSRIRCLSVTENSDKLRACSIGNLAYAFVSSVYWAFSRLATKSNSARSVCLRILPIEYPSTASRMCQYCAYAAFIRATFIKRFS